MGGHVYGDVPADEVGEMVRVTKPGGMVIFCPGIADHDCPEHDYLVAHGFAWSRFEEPGDGIRRKYWKQI